MNTDELLTARATTHGSFADNGRVSQTLKRALRSTASYEHLLDTMREAADMICTKLSRIVSGNPHEPDHWEDIAGYAQLVVAELRERQRFKTILDEIEHDQKQRSESVQPKPGRRATAHHKVRGGRRVTRRGTR